MATPIWITYSVNLGSEDTCRFRILLDNASGEVIFTGIAHKAPGEVDLKVRINDICATYLPREKAPIVFLAASEVFVWKRSFVVQKYTTSWVTVDTVEFCNNWSYNLMWSEGEGLSFPITKIATRQALVFSWINIPARPDIYYHRPTSSTWYLSRVNYSPNGSCTISLIPEEYTTGVIDGIRIDIPGVATREFQIVDSCARFALYYINPYGGWDTFLMDGNYTFSTELQRFNRTSENLFKSIDLNYLNLMNNFVTLNTGILNDEQAAMMGELMNSTNVLLCDLDNGRSLVPVTIVDTSWEEKTFKNQGGKMFNYTIRLKLTKDLVRR